MTWTATEWGMFISLLGATCVSIIFTVQKSKCVQIKCGYVECIRKVGVDIENQNNPDPQPSPITPINPTRVSDMLERVSHQSNVRDQVRKWNDRQNIDD